MTGVVTVYLGLITALAGVVSVISPRIFLLQDRTQALLVLAVGVAIVVIGALLPARQTRAATVRALLDRFLPVHQFSEFHSIRAAVAKEQAYRAVRSVTSGEIFLFSTLTAIRRGGSRGPESILNAPKDQPLLDVAARTTFTLLAEEPGREIVLGTVIAGPPGWRRTFLNTPEEFQSLTAPGFILAAINFLVKDDGPGQSVITTETRVFATNASALRIFAAYWRVIYPGSALIRCMWLRAIAKRAKKSERSLALSA